MIPTTIVITGIAVEIIPVPIPLIITVAGPVSELFSYILSRFVSM